MISRRHFLATALLAPALARQQLPSDSRFIATMPLGNPGGFPTAPFGRLLGTGLDARLFTDLSTLGADESATRPPQSIRSPQSEIRKTESLVTPTDRFFVRTAFPATFDPTVPWSIRVGGLVNAPLDVPLRGIEDLGSASGRYLVECSGNADQSNYGLMSVADWEGIPLHSLLDRVTPSASSHRVLISGVDDERTPSRTSVPGASWIFSRDDLQRAMLVTRMNGASLARDHGLPVRLIVPGWYGCSCIKWVNRIDLVAEDAPLTTQMVEFAARTHQDPRAERARDFIPASLDTAAMPIRVEKWIAGGRIAYHVTGIIWGGSKPTSALQIRFRTSEAWVPVGNCPLPASTLTWSLWSHMWRPTERGRYAIVLRVSDPSIRTRRLDIFFYVREIDIDEV
jgi:DMSO/TMAO reductase YedYZ molybdopterin-dependent catalytic subunit